MTKGEINKAWSSRWAFVYFSNLAHQTPQENTQKIDKKLEVRSLLGVERIISHIQKTIIIPIVTIRKSNVSK